MNDPEPDAMIVPVSTSAAQAAAFYVEVLRENSIWTISDERGFPAPLNGSGERAQPFWSLRSRAEHVLKQVPAFEGFSVKEIPLAEFRDRWLRGMATDRIRVGINWSGRRATGYDLTPAQVEQNIAVAEARETR